MIKIMIKIITQDRINQNQNQNQFTAEGFRQNQNQNQFYFRVVRV